MDFCFRLSLQACKIVLHLPESSEGVKGYNELCRAVVVLMSCGIDYARQTEDLQGRVLVSGGVYMYMYSVCEVGERGEP